MKDEGREKKIGIEQNMPVEITVVGRKLISKTEPTLDTLLAGVTIENLHHEIDVGEIVGNEIW